MASSETTPRPKAPPPPPPPRERQRSAVAIPLVRAKKATGEVPIIVDVDLEDSGPIEVEHASPPPSDADATPNVPYEGMTIDDRYEVVRMVSGGNVGVVYEAKHRHIGNRVAIKVLRPEMAREQETNDRFLLEAQAGSLIRNPHVIQIMDFGTLRDGAAYMVMEYLDGHSLGDIIHKEGRLSEERILHLGQQITEGVGAAHAQKVIHRDLKPDNMLVTEHEDGSEFLTVLDFGVAKVAGTTNKLTAAGTVYGTPHYMSPEQATGKAVDARTDVYALGIILYELCTGLVPFDAENPVAVLSQHLSTPPLAPSEAGAKISEELEAIILKCIEKKAEARYQSMAELGADLKALAGGDAPISVRVGQPASTKELSGTERGQALSISDTSHLDADAFRPKKTRWIGAIVAGLLAMGVVIFVGTRGEKQGASNANSAPSNSAPRVPTAAPEVTSDAKVTIQVALVLSPIDARVYRGKKLLGSMPISVPVPVGEKVTLMVKREGYWAYPLTLDGNKRKVVVRLAPRRGGKAPAPKPAGSGASSGGGKSTGNPSASSMLPPGKKEPPKADGGGKNPPAGDTPPEKTPAKEPPKPAKPAGSGG